MVRPLSMLFSLLLLAGPASAAAVRVDFAGVIDVFEDSRGLFQPQFEQGITFDGHFELDAATALDLGSLSFGIPAGFFVFPIAPFDFTGPSTLSGSVAVGSSTLPVGQAGLIRGLMYLGPSLSPETGVPVLDLYVVPFLHFGVFSQPGSTLESCSITLADPSMTANSGSFYVPANFEGFASATFGCSATLVNFGFPRANTILAQFSGGIRSWVVTPEPSVLAMICGGAGIAAARRRRL